MRPGWRDGRGWGEILAPRPPAPCSQPRYSLPDELRRFLFHLPEGTHRLVFLHGEIKAVREKVKKRKKIHYACFSASPPGKGGSGTTTTVGFKPWQQRRGILRARFNASSALGIYLLGLQPCIRRGLSCPPYRPHALRFPRLHPHRRDWEEREVFPFSRAQQNTGICRKPRRAQPPTRAEGEPRSSRGCCRLPGPPGSSETMLRHPCVGRVGGCHLPRAKERAGGPLNFNKSHSQLYVPVFPVDRVPNHHQKQRQHPEYLPSCVPREPGGGRKKTLSSRYLGFG